PGETPVSVVAELNILETLYREKGNRTKAAEKLGINVRTLRNKLKEYRQSGIDSRYLDLLKMP
ncbi:MAG: helix-turn-helix domain-containing protein, partial [bacterium]